MCGDYAQHAHMSSLVIHLDFSELRAEAHEAALLLVRATCAVSGDHYVADPLHDLGECESTSTGTRADLGVARVEVVGVALQDLSGGFQHLAARIHARHAHRGAHRSGSH